MAATLVPYDAEELVDTGSPADEIALAADAASRRLREAIDRQYIAPDTIDDFPLTAEGEELRALVLNHGIALAHRTLSSAAGAVSKSVATAARLADEWLAEVKAGKVNLSPLTRRTTAVTRQLTVVGRELPGLPSRIWDPVVW